MDCEISVLMPARNAAAYLRQAVESILSQTIGTFELIIVDDGSTDRTHEIAADLARKDMRIKLYRSPGAGIVDALNYAESLSRGNLLARMDADDVTAPDRFEKQLEYLAEHSSHVAVGCFVQNIDSDGCPLAVSVFPLNNTEIYADLLSVRRGGAGLCHPAVMMRRHAFRAVGGYRSKFTRSQDRDLWLRLADVGELGNLPLVLHSLRLHVDSVSQQDLKENYQMRCQAIADALRRRREPVPSFPPFAMGRTDPRDQHKKWATMAAASRRLQVARKHAGLFVRSNPWDIRRYVWYSAFMVRLVGDAICRP